MISRFAVGDVRHPLAHAGLSRTRSPRLRVHLHVGPGVSGEIVSHLGHAAGGRPAERLLYRLGLGVSDDTVLRQLKQCAHGAVEAPTVIGIDDWSWRKSQTYGTIIIDSERRVVIDILEDRDVVTCTNWLRRHP